MKFKRRKERSKRDKRMKREPRGYWSEGYKKKIKAGLK